MTSRVITLRSPLGRVLGGVFATAATATVTFGLTSAGLVYAQTSPESAGIVDLGAAQAGNARAPAAGGGLGPAGLNGTSQSLVGGPTSLSLDQIQDAWAEHAPALNEPLIRVTDDGKLYAVRVRTSMETLFITDPGDPIDDFYLADATGFGASFSPRRPNVVRVRASHTEVDTTLHIVTSRGRIFHFYLEARGPDHEDVPNVAVYLGEPGVSLNDVVDEPGWTSGDWRGAGGDQTGRAGGTPYESPNGPPPNGRTGLEDAVRGALADRTSGQGDSATIGAASGTNGSANLVTRPDWLRNIPFDPRDMRFNDYQVFILTEASREIAPLNVMHDGITTYLYYGDKSDVMEHPVVRQVVDGIDTPVTYNILGDTSDIYAIHTVGTFTLRVGGKIVCIVYTGPDLFDVEPNAIRVLGPDGSVPAATNPAGPEETDASYPDATTEDNTTAWQGAGSESDRPQPPAREAGG